MPTRSQSFVRCSLLVAVLALTVRCSSADNKDVDNCAQLVSRYQTELQRVCNGEPSSWRSGYCSVCANAQLYSYVRTQGGVCVCAPLTFTDGICAGNTDTGMLLSAIVAADGECASYQLEPIDAGTLDAATD